MNKKFEDLSQRIVEASASADAPPHLTQNGEVTRIKRPTLSWLSDEELVNEIGFAPDEQSLQTGLQKAIGGALN